METGVTTVVEASMKTVEEMKEVVVVSTVEKVAEEAWHVPLSNCSILDGKKPIPVTQK